MTMMSVLAAGGYTPQYRVVQFTSIGASTFTVPTTLVGNLSILVIGGGGGGGPPVDEGGGGGGGGGVVYRSSISIPSGEVLTATVGAGGSYTGSGSNSSISSTTIGTVTANGGGAGAGQNGAAGGSGGGAGGAGGYHYGGSSNQASYTGWTSYGNAGGNCPQSDNFPGGGGGGAGGGGGTGGSNNGGAGITNPITGSTVGVYNGTNYIIAQGGSGRYIGQGFVSGAANSGWGGDGSWGYPSNTNSNTTGGSGAIVIAGVW